MRRIIAASLTAVLTLTALLVLAGPASAHTSLDRSDPVDGAVLAAPPAALTLTFTDPMVAAFSSVSITGPSGGTTVDETAGLRAEGTAVVVPADWVQQSGRYEVGYRVLSQDGHPVTGAIAFTLDGAVPEAVAVTSTSAPATTSASPTAAAAVAASDGGAGAPVWPWFVGGAVLIGAAVVLVVRLGREQ